MRYPVLGTKMVPRMGKMAGIAKSISFNFDRFEFINRNKNLKNIVCIAFI